MNKLSDILYKVSIRQVKGETAMSVSALEIDSRAVKPDSCFVAIKGTVADGHDYIDNAVEKGAKAIVCETLPDKLFDNITYVAVENTAVALGTMASNFYGNPSARLKLVGITGTNGKTTVATMLYRLFQSLGHKSGLISTVENRIDDKIIPSTHTTPDAIRLNKLLADMVANGCSFAFMEVSSHALVQHRVAGVDFAGGVFTNISHDHLDYHKTFDSYIEAKKLLFDGLKQDAFSLVNIDDKRGRVMVQNTRSSVNTYGLRQLADFKAKMISNTLQGMELQMHDQHVWFKLIGKFNAYNLLAVFGVAVLLDEDPTEVLSAMSELNGAPGRFELVISPKGITGIVDYAHTPDALENVLETIADLRTGNEQVITVVGAGGNRDTSKRPEMASIAARFSDRVILTSDNPRFEDPMEIIKDMEKGLGPTQVKKKVSLPDRKEAIRLAVNFAEPGDIILIAGKGHETYQEIEGVKHDFDDRAVLKDMFELMND
ncbi:UDP-N-acetylmuramoyl-L-alanyl-D-glutamate--2,6-diaminopimelate ligase [Mangrovivirga cuniculi]|uniref:UDP-N-acetylmuramoyl-L-alanyl-D-glutamate--2,6-diaminopimelate ligase n=1 Tax=Mangrovivirga cuniculi TaxID=2715131 RepID=A0A4D7K106_9BACT|nr:UDP-N-acetylmuramoyl-L-alanyl-D-glutamate--2,6-diaminopimelate ligase [Mangrovivirga cuniculi]QCK14554.1 UDP-N-acetylmuramoyl-L-alanyl-D-glutamate--2,6-diaminopimelate ligase [Mangrovivirga cuniculi]